MSKETKKSFQWKKGENYANVEIFDREITLGDITYYVFKSGRQINKEVLDEFMVVLEDPNLPVIDPMLDPAPEEQTKKTNSFSDYPTIEELESKRNGDGSFSDGKADVIPHPDQVEKLQQFFNKQKKESPQAPKVQKSIKEDTQINQKNIQQKSPAYDIINKAKKQEFELTLTVKVKLPVQHFFDLLDEDFLKANQTAILSEMIAKIKREDLDVQIKENLIRIYNIQEEKQCTTEDQEEK